MFTRNWNASRYPEQIAYTVLYVATIHIHTSSIIFHITFCGMHRKFLQMVLLIVCVQLEYYIYSGKLLSELEGGERERGRLICYSVVKKKQVCIATLFNCSSMHLQKTGTPSSSIYISSPCSLTYFLISRTDILGILLKLTENSFSSILFFTL